MNNYNYLKYKKYKKLYHNLFNNTSLYGGVGNNIDDRDNDLKNYYLSDEEDEEEDDDDEGKNDDRDKDMISDDVDEEDDEEDEGDEGKK